LDKRTILQLISKKNNSKVGAMNTTTTTTLSDSSRTIFRSAARFFSGTLLSRVTGMLRDICMAYAFGTQSGIAALLVAFRFAHLLRRLLGEGAMQTALIPHFEELRKSSPQRAGRFFCDLTATLTHLLLVIIFATMVCLGGLLYWNVLDAGNTEIAWLTFLMMPSLLFICLFGINASLMQCEKSFFLSSAAPVAFNLFWIAGIFISSRYPSAAMSILSLFIIAACFAQWACTLPKVYAILKGFDIDALMKHAKKYSKDVIKLGKPLSLGIIGIGAAQINNALDAVFARWADPEGPAILWYAIRIQQLPLALFGIAIANALLPPLARAGKANDQVQFSRFLETTFQKTVFLMLPITAGIFLFGGSSVQLIYGRGDFTAYSALNTTQSLWGYGAGLVPMALVLILAPAFYSRGNYRTPTQASVWSMALNAALNALLVAGWGLGAASVAIATSVSAWVNCIWLGAALQRQAPWISKRLLTSVLRTLLATCAASAAAWAVSMAIWDNSDVYAASFIELTARLGVGGVVFLGVFALFFLGKSDIRDTSDSGAP
jgi:putative peptidoglycan lipid II flippase